MCAIVDADVAHEVFGADLPPAGERFFDWIEKGSRRLVVGGKLLEELERYSEGFREWARTAVSAGKMRIVSKDKVDARTEEVKSHGGYKSNDPHVLALAQLSGARLLYSNDRDLGKDFGNKKLIDNPPGKVYTTRPNPRIPAQDPQRFTSSKKRLLQNESLCAPEK